MGTYSPKPYKKFNRLTQQWETVIPKPVEFISASERKHRKTDMHNKKEDFGKRGKE